MINHITDSQIMIITVGKTAVSGHNRGCNREDKGEINPEISLNRECPVLQNPWVMLQIESNNASSGPVRNRHM